MAGWLVGGSATQALSHLMVLQFGSSPPCSRNLLTCTERRGDVGRVGA